MRTDELEHYGIKGMKWGVRRTPEQLGHKTETTKKKSSVGKKVAIGGAVLAAGVLAAYGAKKTGLLDKSTLKKGSTAIAKIAKKPKKVRVKDAIRVERNYAFKNRRSLSDEDLKDRIKRLKLEKEFRDLQQDDLYQGQAMVKDILKSSGPQAAKIMTSGTILYAAKVGMTKTFSWKEAADYITPKPKKK